MNKYFVKTFGKAHCIFISFSLLGASDIRNKDKNRTVGVDGRKKWNRLQEKTQMILGLYLAPWQLADSVITSCSNTNPVCTKRNKR